MSLSTGGVRAAAEIMYLANDRCNQETMIERLQRVGATRMPVCTLLSRWA